MRLLIQRVERASVSIEEAIKSEIGRGLLLFVGIEHSDTEADIEWIANKLIKMRIFDDGNGVMNLDVIQVGADILIVSQFTLHASTKRGNRPSYIKSAPESISRPLYDKFTARVSQLLGHEAKTGEFGATMQVSLVNDGPVTILIDSKAKE